MEKYHKSDFLGNGSNGNAVYKAINKSTGKVYAMKKMIINTSNFNDTKSCQNEVKILQSLDHPYIVKYYESFIYKEKLCLIMEYADDGDLNNCVRCYNKLNQEKENINDYIHIEEKLVINNINTMHRFGNGFIKSEAQFTIFIPKNLFIGI